jgi:hypothetical protein
MTRRPNRPGQAILAVALNLCILSFAGVVLANSFAPLLA